ncbi:MAG: tetratricopeptide repeat protein [Desulfofustis sp.]|nr:tetratricopeptide repeat protein [Desulfofustis sp.]
MNDIGFERSEEHSIIHIEFTLPIRYVRHFPLEYGREVRIQLRPILSNVQGSLEVRAKDALFPPEQNTAGLTRVEYDGSGGQPTITLTFARARSYSVQQGTDFRSLNILLPNKGDDAAPAKKDGGATDKPKEESGTLLTDAGEFETPSGLPALSEERQSALLAEGEALMKQENYMQAIHVYTRLLDSPDPKIRELAQFQLATAQEKKGHLAHARGEYEKYLQDYPEGPHSQEVEKQLENLLSTRFLSGTEDRESLWQSEIFGSIGQSYERDESYPDFEGSSGADESIVNYSTLVSTFDATYRLSNGTIATETVVVGSYEGELEEGQDNRFRGNSIYLELEDYRDTFFARAGRQTASSGGVLGRFDGAIVGYRLTDSLKLNMVGGFPVERSYDGFETDRYFYGANLDLGPFAEHWDFNLYFINQLADGIDDRRSLGLEARYTSDRFSLFSLIDYDLLYDEPAIMLFSGNWLLPNDRSRIYFSADYRTSPILSTHNALIGQIYSSLDDLVDTLGEDEVRQLAKDRTLESRYVTVGVSHPISDNLQIAGDMAWARLDGAPASGGVEAIESLGDEYYYSLQVYGSNLLMDGDLSTLGLRYSDTKKRDTYSLLLSARYPYPSLRDLRISPKLRIDYRSNNEQPGDQWQLRPGLAVEYEFVRQWRLLLEGEYRWADQELEGLAEDKEGYFLSAGFRWDF